VIQRLLVSASKAVRPRKIICPVTRPTNSYIEIPLPNDSMVEMKRIPKLIPPRSRVRLVRADKQTPSWNKHLGRQFRIGYYSRKDGLDCIWLVNENGKYEQTTESGFHIKVLSDRERISREELLRCGKAKPH
jgi:hypothetical protein